MSKDKRYKDQLNEYISRLVVVTHRLKKISTVILILVLCSVISFAIDSFAQFTNGSKVPIYYFLVVGFSIAGIAAIYYFDQTKDTGLALYDIIGDALEWLRLDKVDDNDQKLTSNNIKRRFTEEDASQILNTQYALSSFARAKNLPIFPVPNSQAAYLTIFISLIVLGGMLKVLSPM